MLSDEYFGAHKSEPQGKCNSSHMCPTGTCIINVFKTPGNAIKVNTHVDTQARPCVYVFVSIYAWMWVPCIFSYLSTRNWTCIYMSSGNKWHIKNISFVLPTGTSQENRCLRPLLTISVAGAQIRHATTPTFLQALLPLVRHLPAHPPLHNPDISPPLGLAQSTLSSLALALPFSLTSLSHSLSLSAPASLRDNFHGSRVRWTWPRLSQVC